MSSIVSYDEWIQIPRAVRFPIEMVPPPHFDPERLETWPHVDGRLEFVEGRLLFMPPSGDLQQYTTTDVVISLGTWVRRHSEFVLATNEAGMRLRGATRAADVALWRRADLGATTGGLQRVPPVLAVEVAGTEEGDREEALRTKARWYLDAGVPVIWLVLPILREVLVVTPRGEDRFALGSVLPEHPELPGLTPSVEELFTQIGTGR